MDAETLEALKGSIAKWEAIVAGTGADHGSQNCALCQKFDGNEHCDGCPVADFSGDSCGFTPFMDWVAHQRAKHLGKQRCVHEGCDECARLATAELDFLKSLLPVDRATPQPKGG